MSETPPNPPRKKRELKPRSGLVTSFKVNNIPWDLYDRINGKAGFVGMGRDEWIREVMERETRKGILLEREWKREQREYDARKTETSDTRTESDDQGDGGEEN
jgi:hypothetical protein